MNFDFYADRSDAINVLSFAFDEMNLILFDLYSDYGQKVGQYGSVAEVERKLKKASDLPDAYFQVWSSCHRGKPWIEKVKLDPKRCEGHTFRYTTRGWGMIQLYFDFPNSRGLSPSHIGHFEECGAFSRAGIENRDDVAQWDWPEIRRTSRKLRYHIQTKLAVAKVSKTDSRDILPGAKELFDSGVTRLHV